MNEEIILQMIQPYVKDGFITYNEFDGIFEFLSLKEQYAVVELLFEKGISLKDNDLQDDISSESLLLSDEDENVIKEMDEVSVEEFEILYDESIFKDKNTDDNQVVLFKNIQQSNTMLCKLVQEGNRQARQDICIKNKLLVDKYVNAYLNYFGNRLDFEDLEQAGFIGLIKAAERFDIEKDSAFSTYAVFWIRQSIVREVMDNGFAIRVPVHVMEQIAKVTRLDNQLGLEEIGFRNRIQMIAKELEMPEEKIESLLVIRQNYLSYSSLNTPIGEEEDSELGDFCVRDEQLSVEDEVSAKMLKEQLTSVLDTLNEKEQKILRLRFGLDDNRERTLEEVGKVFHVTRERIRQIESKALRKLRHPSRSRKLRDYLE